MLRGLIEIIATLAKWLFKRGERKPERERERRANEIDRDIATKDSAAATLHGSRDLDVLSELHNRKDR